MPGVLKEQQGGPCGWSRVREREGGGKGREGTGQVVQCLVGQEDLGFHPKGGGSPGELWAAGPDSGVHWRPLVAAMGKTD